MSTQVQASAADDVPLAPATPPAPTEACRNCDTPRVGDYCHACGQHYLDGGRLSVRSLTLEFLAQHLSFQQGFLRTFIELTIRPGRMIREYVGGRRQRYTNPVAYLTLATATYLVLHPLWQAQYAASLRADSGSSAFADIWVNAMLWLDQNPLASALLTSILFAPPLRVLFGKRTTLAEVFAFSFYVFAQITWFTLMVTVAAWATGADVVRVQEGTSWIFLLGVIAYAGLGYFGARLSVVLRLAGAFVLTIVPLFAVMLTAVVVIALLRGAAA